MKEVFRKLVIQFQQEKVVEYLYQANDTLDRVSRYRQVKNKHANLLSTLATMVDEEQVQLVKIGGIFPGEAIEMCLVCMMAGVNEDQVLSDYHQLYKALKGKKDHLKDVAFKMATFLGMGKGEEGESFTNFPEDILISKFF